MIGIFNPWVLLGVGIAWATSIAGASLLAFNVGRDHEIAGQARTDKAVAAAGDKAASAAAGAIAKLEVKHVTIRQRTDTITREVPVYRDCVHDQRVLDDINAARTGRAVAPGGGQLPAASAPHR